VTVCDAGGVDHQDDRPQLDDELADDADIVGEAPPVDEYRLSTRPAVVGGGS